MDTKEGKGHAVPPALRSVAESAPVAPVTLPQNQPWAMNPPRINDVKILKKVASWLCAHLLLLNCYNSVVMHFCTYELSWVRCPRMYWHSTAIVVFRLAISSNLCNDFRTVCFFVVQLQMLPGNCLACPESNHIERNDAFRPVPFKCAAQLLPRTFCQIDFIIFQHSMYIYI